MSNQITLRLPDIEYRELMKEAEEREIPLAAYVRLLLQLHLDRKDLDSRIISVVDERIKSKLMSLLEQLS